ncbi:unnamed protein product [Cunninghamella echinulata]
METNQHSFLSLTSNSHHQQIKEEEHDHTEQNISTHDAVEWFLYAEDHSTLTTCRPPSTYLKLTPNNNNDGDDQQMYQDNGSTHEPSSAFILLNDDNNNQQMMMNEPDAY